MKIKQKLRAAFEAGKLQQQIQGRWYPTKAEADADFNAWYKKFKHKHK